MQIGSATSFAVQGMRAASQQLAQSAQNVANVNTPGYVARDSSAVTRGGSASVAGGVYTRAAGMSAQDLPPSSTDLVSETVTQITSLRAFQANLASLRTADTMTGELLKLGA